MVAETKEEGLGTEGRCLDKKGARGEEATAGVDVGFGDESVELRGSVGMVEFNDKTGETGGASEIGGGG